jgi:hypothetical protein
MLSRRSFAQLCGVSALSLWSGLEASDSTGVHKSRTIALDNDLFSTDFDKHFSYSSEQEFPLDFFAESKSESSVWVPVSMYHQTVSYKKEYADRLSFVNRMKQTLIEGMKKKIQVELISLLIAAGLEKGISSKSKIQFGSKAFEYIASPEAVESYLIGQYVDFSNITETVYLGKIEEGRQEMFERNYNFKCSGDLSIRVRPDRKDNRVIVNLPTLPPLMGFDTQFEFDTKTHKVTEKPLLVDGMNSISLAYFSGSAILCNRDVQLMDIKTDGL